MRRLVAITLALSLAGSISLSAQGKGRGKGPEGKPQNTEVNVLIGDPQRKATRDFFVMQYGRGNCPEGLAKKNNGCLPPGQAKKRYVVGQPLPAGVSVSPIPAGLVLRLGPPPPGYRYGLLDGDLLKLAVGTMLVVDAIDALVQ